MTERSRSPYNVIANVRGIGVAVITSVLGFSPFAMSCKRWTTPKRCCSSMVTIPRFLKSVRSSRSACVPTITWISPKAIFSSNSCFVAFFQHAVLRRGWKEWQNHFDLLTDPLRGLESNSFARPALNTAQGENQLEQEEFFEDETPVVGRAALIQLRKLVIPFRKMYAF